nr:hypothetical protein Csa_1G024225 [Ipomoea batatas]
MRAAARPVNPRDAAIRGRARPQNVHQRRQVMLVAVTRRKAVVAKHGVIFLVGHDFGGEVAADLEPLGAFPPVVEGDGGGHAAVVAAAAGFAGIVVGLQEA